MCFTILSLSLIGIPPAGGFYSKWYLAIGALEGAGSFTYVIPALLLVSALLTAGYLLPIVGKAFYPGTEISGTLRREHTPVGILVPLLVFAAASILPGIFFPAVENGVLSLTAGIFG